MKTTDFNQWLHSRDIDSETLTAELEQALFAQFEDEHSPPPTVVLVAPSDCLWPARMYRVAP